MSGIANRRLVAGSLVAAIAVSVAGFPFEARDAHDWSGLLFVVWGLALFLAGALLAVTAGRERNDPAALGFAAVAVYGIGTTLNSSLLARGLADASVGIQPGVWSMLALGLLLVAFSGWFARWVRIVGAIAAVGHAAAAVALLFGAEMPPTGAEPSDWAPLVVAVSKLFLWAALVGWIVEVRAGRDRASSGYSRGSQTAARRLG